MTKQETKTELGGFAFWLKDHPCALTNRLFTCSEFYEWWCWRLTKSYERSWTCAMSGRRSRNWQGCLRRLGTKIKFKKMLIFSFMKFIISLKILNIFFDIYNYITNSLFVPGVKMARRSLFSQRPSGNVTNSPGTTTWHKSPLFCPNDELFQQSVNPMTFNWLHNCPDLTFLLAFHKCQDLV